jgi:ethanolaminephosphotransferase
MSTVERVGRRLTIFMSSDQTMPHTKAHDSNGADHSMVSNFFMRHYWVWVMCFSSLWFGTNVITLLGLAFALVSFTVTDILSSGFTLSLPSWAAW